MRGTVDAGGVDEWTLHFVGGRPATVHLHGRDLSRIHCILRDAAGSRIDSVAGSVAGCRLQLVPARTAAYHVLIRNTADGQRSYWLVAQ
jgi:hypothetical protein